MKLKKVVAVALTAALVGSTAVTAVAAKTTTPDDVYHYVALGDSITAGYGLTSEGDNFMEKFASDRALVITDELLADPIKEAYPAVFGEYLAQQAAKYGIEASTANLAACAYRADDVAKVILEDGYVSRQGIGMVAMAGNDKVDALGQYHNIMVKYLTDADLVSIQLGGNDVLLGFFSELGAEKNPVLSALATSLYTILIGGSAEDALNAALKQLEQNKDSITLDTITDAIRFISGVKERAGDMVANASNQVKNVVDAVRTVNSEADVAVLGMFDPYGNSLEYQGQVRDFCTVSQNILSRVIGEMLNIDVKVNKPTQNLTDTQLNEKVRSFSGISVQIKYIIDSKAIRQAQKERLEKLMSIAADEIAYPLQYLLAGRKTGQLMQALNAKLADVAETTNSTYVDVYGISNELNLDPHPNANGHSEIAAIMADTLSDVVAEGMAADKVPEPLTNVSTMRSDTIKLGEKVKVRGVANGGTGDYQYAFYYKKATSEKWTRVHDFSEVRAVNITPAKAVDYDVLVKIRDSEGTVVEKTFTLHVTK